MKARLNKRTVTAATYEGPGGCYLWDTETRGFGLRIYPSGKKSFVITYNAKGRQRFYTVGKLGEMTLPEARTEALELLAGARRGEDPSGNRLAARRAPTMSDLADRFMDEHARIKKKARSVKRDRQAWDRCVLPSLGRRKVADIDRADVAKLITDMADTPAMANKVISLLSKAFNLAEIWGLRPEGTNPCRHISRYREESRERFLSDRELSRLGDVLAEVERTWGVSSHAIAAIRLLILTGCRSSEILTLRWAEVDFERRCLRLPDSKTGRKTVLLNAGALQILSDLERIEGNPFVIPGLKKGTHRSSLQPLWERIREQAGIEDVRIHDLRHTFASFGVNAGLNLPVIGKLLGHSKTATTERYAHLADDPVRKATEATTYPQVARRVADVAEAIEEKTGHDPEVYVDATGLGMPVVDLLSAETTRVWYVTPVYFTHGDRRSEEGYGRHREIRLGKAFLVSRLQTLLQTRCLHLPRTSEAEILARELRDYEIEVTEDANDRYGAFKVGTQDDLVTALGLAVQCDPPAPGIY